MYSQVSNSMHSWCIPWLVLAVVSALQLPFCVGHNRSLKLENCPSVPQPECTKSVKKKKRESGEMTTLFMPVLSVQCWVCECCGLYRSKCLDLLCCLVFPFVLSFCSQEGGKTFCLPFFCDFVQLA